MTALSPGASPPPVLIAILFVAFGMAFPHCILRNEKVRENQAIRELAVLPVVSSGELRCSACGPSSINGHVGPIFKAAGLRIECFDAARMNLVVPPVNRQVLVLHLRFH